MPIAPRDAALPTSQPSQAPVTSSTGGAYASSNGNGNNNSNAVKVLSGSEAVVAAILRVIANSKGRCDGCGDIRSRGLIVRHDQIWQALQELRRRGVRPRSIVEVTSDNLPFVKEAAEFMELRHLGGIKGNFAVTDSEYISTALLALESRPGEPAPQMVYSNLQAMVEQHQYLFETLWDKAVPAEQRIREIEQGIEPPHTTVLNSQEEIEKAIAKSIRESDSLAVYSGTEGMQMVYNHYLGLYREVLARQKTGGHGGIRWLISVDRENKDLVRVFVGAGVQVRHSTYLSPMTFALDGRALYMTVDEMPGGRMIQGNYMVTNEPPYVKHFTLLFEELWSDGTDAMDKVGEIESGTAAETEVIRNPGRIERLYKETINNAEKEVMLIWTAPSAFVRKKNRGIVDLLKRAAERGAKVRIMVSESSIKGNSGGDDDAKKEIEELAALGIRMQKLSQRPLEAAVQEEAREGGVGPHVNAAIVDGKVSWIIEIKDASKESFAEATGTAVMSTGRSVVLSYVRIFEALWLEAELVARLRETDAMQRDFVNVAAHELRTPITSMLMAASNARPASDDAAEVAMTRMQYDIILRNAKRLAGLVNDILDASRIESGTFALRKEPADLGALAREVVAEAQAQEGVGLGGRLKIEIRVSDGGSSGGGGKGVMVRADPDRIRQVFVNLLTNAAKFTDDGGTITVSVRAEGDQAAASVSDTGSGIDEDMLPRLFQKFAARSFKGIGLGLYICRWIVEAHGGRIWAENNPPGGAGGATFTFVLPTATTTAATAAK